MLGVKVKDDLVNAELECATNMDEFVILRENTPQEQLKYHQQAVTDIFYERYLRKEGDSFGGERLLICVQKCKNGEAKWFAKQRESPMCHQLCQGLLYFPRAL